MTGEQWFSIKVWGDYACFTRPEFKVERVSYPIITPSAARGLLEAIFWKPEIAWELRAVEVLKPLQHTALLRNEVEGRQGSSPIFVEDRRQQRTSLLLRDVAYILHASLRVLPHATSPFAKYADQVSRRLTRGQYHHTPYLGTREFPAFWELASGDDQPLALDLDLGPILFDVAFREDPARREMTFHRHGADGRRVAAGYTESLFFNAVLRNGVMEVPQVLYRERDRLEGRDVA